MVEENILFVADFSSRSLSVIACDENAVFRLTLTMVSLTFVAVVAYSNLLVQLLTPYATDGRSYKCSLSNQQK